MPSSVSDRPTMEALASLLVGGFLLPDGQRARGGLILDRLAEGAPLGLRFIADRLAVIAVIRFVGIVRHDAIYPAIIY